MMLHPALFWRANVPLLGEGKHSLGRLHGWTEGDLGTVLDVASQALNIRPCSPAHIRRPRPGEERRRQISAISGA